MSFSEKDLVEILFPYVRSVFRAKNQSTPEFIGSGILLNGNQGVYLITAAHVMDHFKEEIYPLFLDCGTDGRLVQISGYESCSYTEDFVKRSDDDFDISIVRIGNEMLTDLNFECIVGIDKIDVSIDHDPSLGYFCVGIPSKKGNKSIDEKSEIINPEPYGICGSEVDEIIYSKVGVSKSTHLAISFNAKKAYSTDGTRFAAPALNGLSGAPIWGLRKVSDGQVKAVVVAILIEYHQRDIKAVLGTRASEIFRGTLL
ncbi:hypothetical protein LH51_00805 [Nitrincola sp. A-D6]|uniref:hypothetical protein n=1 Tax=Nitrincola sp. A-D6 TaxID=1545442 RepID=UPI00051FCE2E|nr:hypothetical protein [Nitrincola sp. A-D6]KGK43321.1 hypothetical protein LH51_00805 [Nitrincola sp. A-D6]